MDGDENARRRDFEAQQFEMVNLIVDCGVAASAVQDLRRRQRAAHVRLATLGSAAPARARQSGTARRWLGARLMWLGGWLVGGPRAAGRTDASSATQTAGAQ